MVFDGASHQQKITNFRVKFCFSGKFSGAVNNFSTKTVENCPPVEFSFFNTRCFQYKIFIQSINFWSACAICQYDKKLLTSCLRLWSWSESGSQLSTTITTFPDMSFRQFVFNEKANFENSGILTRSDLRILLWNWIFSTCYPCSNLISYYVCQQH